MPLNTWDWRGGDLNTVVGSSECISFAGPGGDFDTPLLVGDTQGQEGTYVRSIAAGTNGGELPNCMFVNASQALVDAVVVGVSEVAPSSCTLRVRLTTFLTGSVGTTHSFFDAYGATPVDSPGDGDVSVYAFEQGNSIWSSLDYVEGDRLSLTNHSIGLTHDFYIGLSARVGAEGTFNNITLRIVIEYFS